MSTRRRAETLAVSFFAFQDIIAGVTGIMLILTLVLAVDLSRRRPALQNTDQPADSLETLQEHARAIEATRDELRNIVSTLRRRLQGAATSKVVTESEIRTAERILRDLDTERVGGQQEIGALYETLRYVQNEIAEAESRHDMLQRKRETQRALAAEAAKRTPITVLQGEAASKKPILIECRADALIIGSMSRNLLDLAVMSLSNSDLGSPGQGTRLRSTLY
jgi:DNA repair exonuclease SbcCD ATPase subunit